MDEKLPFGEGVSINRPPLLYGVNYQFWKVIMNFFVESIDRRIWDVIINGPFILKHEIGKMFVEKPWSQWTETEGKKVQYDCIIENIITFALSSDEFFRVSQCS